LNQFPISQYDSLEKQQRHNEIQNESVEFNIQFGNISETEIPKVVNGKIESVKAGNNLTNDDLFNAFKLVGYNLGNIGVVLLLIYQYNSNMWNKTTIKRTEDKEVEKKLIRCFHLLIIPWKVISQLHPAHHLDFVFFCQGER
jgi:hypothetical protein